MALFFEGWLLFALLVILMGLRHPAPLNDFSKLSMKTKGLGVAAFLILMVTFVPQPMLTITPDHGFQATVVGGNNTTASVGEFVDYSLVINNTGNSDIHMNIVISDIPGDGWSGAVYLGNGTIDGATNALNFDLVWESSTTIIVHLQPSATTTMGEKHIVLDMWSQDNVHTFETLNVNIVRK
jgi:uncharacterized repeat protein (TIGR01451 family)